MPKNLTRIIGLIGTAVCIIIYAQSPSFPTPDKILIFVTFVFMISGQAVAVLKRLAPFVAALLAYESFRGLVPHLNNHVNYNFMIGADKMLGFNQLPTVLLQNWLWHGAVSWYDFVFYLFYMAHFVLPFSLAILIWKTREKYYWQYVYTFLTVSFAGFLTFLTFPAAPPWLAVQKGLIPPITRISSQVWSALGVHDFPSLYNKISPNPVAAVPSLHAAYATLFTIFVYKLFGKKWALVSAIYPLAIYIGTVYQGEHYLIDEIIGAGYAIGAYLLVKTIYLKRQKAAIKQSTTNTTNVIK